MNKAERLRSILELMKDFVDGNISAKNFERKYMLIWNYIRDKSLYYSHKIQTILDELFTDVDTFESNNKLLKELRKEMKEDGYTIKQINKMYTDEEGLKKYVKAKLKKLTSVLKKKK